MDIQFEKKIDSYGILNLNIRKEDYKDDFDKKLKTIAKKVNLKGFRHGKVPISIINKMYGTKLKMEVINEKVNESLSEYFKEKNIKPIFPPANYGKSLTIDSILYSDNFELNFELCFEPEFTYDLKKYECTDYKVTISEEDIKKELSLIQDAYGTYVETKDKSKKNNRLIGEAKSVSGNLTKKDFPLIISSIPKEAQEQFIQLTTGSVVNVNFGKILTDKQLRTSFQIDEKEELAPYQSEWEYTITKVERKRKADLDISLFDKILEKDQVKNTEEFKVRIKENLLAHIEEYNHILFKNEIRKKMLEDITFKLPEDFIKRNLKKETANKDFLQTLDALRWNIIVRRIARNDKIEVNEEEIREDARNSVRNILGKSSNIQADTLESVLDNYLKYKNEENYTMHSEKVLEKKILEYLRENVILKTKEISRNDFNKIVMQTSLIEKSLY